MDRIQRYIKYRNLGMNLTAEILDKYVNKDILEGAAELLGILGKGNTLVYQIEEDANVLMDFILNDYKVNGTTIINIYTKNVGGKNEIENEILDALTSSYTSLFEVTSTFEEESVTILNDIINKKNNIELTDISLSISAVPDILIFFRIMPFEFFNITTGVGFTFPADKKTFLLSRYKAKRKKFKSSDEAIKRFVLFFKLKNQYGMDFGYI